jgi:hypothetical protein
METWAGDPGWTDITYSADITPVSGTDVWLTFRVQNKDNYYLFTLSTSKLWKLVNGDYTELKQGTGSFSSGNTYSISVQLSGSSIKVFSGSTQVLDHSDTQFSSGYVGFGGNNATGTFDNAMVTGSTGSVGIAGNTVTLPAGPGLVVSGNPVRSGERITVRAEGTMSGRISLYTVNGDLAASWQQERSKGAVIPENLVPGVYYLECGGRVTKILLVK